MMIESRVGKMMIDRNNTDGFVNKNSKMKKSLKGVVKKEREGRNITGAIFDEKGSDRCWIPFMAVAKKTSASGFHFKAVAPSNDLMSMKQQHQQSGRQYDSIPFEETIMKRLEKVRGEDFSTYNTSFLPKEKLKWFVTKRREWIYILITDQEYPYRIAIECLESLIRLFAPLKQRRTADWVRTACCDHIIEEWGILKQGTLLWEMLREDEEAAIVPVAEEGKLRNHKTEEVENRNDDYDDDDDDYDDDRDDDEKQKEAERNLRICQQEEKIESLEKLVVDLMKIVEVKDETEHILQKQLNARSETTSHLEKELQRMNGRSKSILEQTKVLKESIEILTNSKRNSFLFPSSSSSSSNSKEDGNNDGDNANDNKRDDDNKNGKLWKIKRFASLSKHWIEKLQCALPSFTLKDDDGDDDDEEEEALRQQRQRQQQHILPPDGKMDMVDTNLSSSPSSNKPKSRRVYGKRKGKIADEPRKVHFLSPTNDDKPCTAREMPERTNPFLHFDDMDWDEAADSHRCRHDENIKMYHPRVMYGQPSPYQRRHTMMNERNNPFAY